MMTLEYYIKRIKLYLVFFCYLILLVSCKSDINTVDVTVIYKAEKAVGISFSSKLSLKNVQVFLEDNLETPVLGTMNFNGVINTFEPIIPFSNGQNYKLYIDNLYISSFSIPQSTNVETPELIAIYPTINIVPENLLKMYFQFSKPMQEVGSSLDFITVTNNTTNKTVDVFLDLKSELWNAEHTQLTLWLDPGRIKTGLIPNKEKGLPLLKDNVYSLKISSHWKDAKGTTLIKNYEKTFNVVGRDEHKPSANQWELITTPKLLTIHFNEPLDGILALESFSIINASKELIQGDYKLINAEQTLEFRPNSNFQKGIYSIIVESRLEDLAGNNLNHLFDEDLNNKTTDDNLVSKTLSFTIQ